MALVIRDAKALLNHPLQINAAPADHAVPVTVGSSHNQCREFRLLVRRQAADRVVSSLIPQAIGPFGIEAVNPVSQCLAVHRQHRCGSPRHGPPPGPEVGVQRSHAGCAQQSASGQRPNSYPVASPPSSSASSSRSKRIGANTVRHFTYESVATSFGIIGPVRDPLWRGPCQLVSS